MPVKDSPCFLVNRVPGPSIDQALRMVDEGVAPEVIDAAVTAFAMPMGRIELADTVGRAICLAVGKELAGEGAEPPKKLAELVAAGNLGKKTGRGFYVWRDGKTRKGTSRGATPELTEKLIAPYLREARAALPQGIVADADLADAGLIFATRFAAFLRRPLNHPKSKGRKSLRRGSRRSHRDSRSSVSSSKAIPFSGKASSIGFLRRFQETTATSETFSARSKRCRMSTPAAATTRCA